MDIEVWRKYPEFDGYLISNYGRIYSEKIRKVLATYPTQDGHHRLHLWSNGKRYHRLVHVMVAKVFLPSGKDGEIVRHLDGVPSNNIYLNLAYGTHADNSADREKHGTDQHSHRNPNAKLNWDLVAQMRAKFAEGMKCKEVSELFNVPEPTVYSVLTERSWKKK